MNLCCFCCLGDDVTHVTSLLGREASVVPSCQLISLLEELKSSKSPEPFTFINNVRGQLNWLCLIHVPGFTVAALSISEQRRDVRS